MQGYSLRRTRLRRETQVTDGDIVRAVLAGDRERYAQLVERYRDRYARYAARMLGSVDAAEDAVQDAFVRAFDQLAQCKDPNKFVGWFFLILRNRCFAERRRSRAEASLEAADSVAAADRTDGGAETAERRRALQLALLALTPDQREVFVLKHVEGLSYGEIAERLSTSIPSLKMRMHRAYDKLREELREHT
ncbi:MAG: RNA polymerase subunit sigma-70 [Gemmatimonadetes bacterium]|nr:MAG: RNA polymerase subunit sigma-70 [Gemmatimonadota bacterium]